jgi:flagellar hook protein FlgE
MLTSMWSGVSGLRTHQQGMDVIGNDIANVNTIAYKQSNVSFKDQLYKTLASPQEGTAGRQVGIGSSVGSISTDFSTGALQQTGVNSHIALSGNGFFVLRDAAGANTSFTRAGDFKLTYNSTTDARNLMGPNGKYLYGTTGAATGSASDIITIPKDATELAISSDGVVSYRDGTGAPVNDAFRIDIAVFGSSDGLLKAGDNQYLETSASGAAQFGAYDGAVIQNSLENSNVDLAKEFTEMIVTERGFQANSKIITTSDSMLQELLNLKR